MGLGQVLAAPQVRRLLVVDDDRTVAEVVSVYLTNAGYEVARAEDGSTALELAAADLPDLVILDLMLPGVPGLEVCRRLRALGPVPIIMLTARTGEEDRIIGLECGADDYVTKPFSPRELVARVDAVLRRVDTHPAQNRMITISDRDLRIDLAAREVSLRGKPVGLTTREYDLLAFMAGNPRTAFSRELLLHRVWDWSFGDVSTVTVHIRRLREKIEDDPANPKRLVTVWGTGYRYEPSELSP
jgi:two-component system response regulator ResD